MKVGRIAVRRGYSLIGALVVISFWQSGALAQDHQSLTPQHQTSTRENNDRTNALVKIVRESTRRFQDENSSCRFTKLAEDAQRARG